MATARPTSPYRIVITRLSSHPPTRAYAGRCTKEGLPEQDIIRCLKRYVAREACPHVCPVGRITPPQLRGTA